MLDKLGLETKGDMLPPIDIHWIWHVHMLSPKNYARDCEELYMGKVFHHKLRPNMKKKREETREHWKKFNPDEPFELDFHTAYVKYGDILETFESPFEYDIFGSALRQKEFYYQVLSLQILMYW